MMSYVFESMLNFDFYAVRKRQTPDGVGGWDISYYELDSILGRLRPASTRERESAQQEQRVITHVFYCLGDVDIGRGDVISKGVISIDGHKLSSPEIMVKVEGNRNPSTADEHFEIDCFQIQNDLIDIAYFRLLESGDIRSLESGGFRLLE